MIETLRRLGHSSIRADRMRVGTLVGIALAVLTVLEYLAAVIPIPPVILWLAIAAIAKTWLILEFFMHVRQVRSGEES